jgi:hypothetical protein
MGKRHRARLSSTRVIVHAVVLGALLIGSGCSRYGRVEDSYPREFYEVPKRFPDNRMDKNPRFVIYGDNRPGWRAKEVVANKDTWLTWKQLYLPIVYQLYIVGSGLVGGVNYLVWNPDYGATEARMVRDAMYARGQDEGFDFIINTGDIATDGRRAKDWKRFLEQNKEDVPLVTEYPYLPTPGNHDMTIDSTYGLPNYTAIFSYPPFYVFECPDVDFFIVDSDYLIDYHDDIDDALQDKAYAEWFISGNPGKPAWLERHLAASNKTFKIVIMHHPPIAFSEHHDNWERTDYGNNLIEKRRRLFALFEEQGVQMVFSGHQHNYERSSLLFARDDGREASIQFVITGGGGSPQRALPNEDTLDEYMASYTAEGLNVVRRTQEKIYHYCVVDVQPDRISVQAIETSKSDETDGHIVDEFVIGPTGRQQ